METELFVYYRNNQAPVMVTQEQAESLLQHGHVQTPDGTLTGPGTVLQLQPDDAGDVTVGDRRFTQVGATEVPGQPDPAPEPAPRRRRERLPKSADLASLQPQALQAPPAAALVGSVSAMERITLAALQRSHGGPGGPAVELLAEIEGLRDDLDNVASARDLQDLGAMVAQMVENQAQLAEQVNALSEYVQGIVAQMMGGGDEPEQPQP